MGGVQGQGVGKELLIRPPFGADAPNFGNELEAAICSKSSRLSNLDGNMFVGKKLIKTKKFPDLHNLKKL